MMRTTRIAVLGLCRTAINSTSATIVFMSACQVRQHRAKNSFALSTAAQLGSAGRPAPLRLSAPPDRFLYLATLSAKIRTCLWPRRSRCATRFGGGTRYREDELRREETAPRPRPCTGNFATEGERARAKEKFDGIIK
ncbi:hypothetical protein DFH11DRAFT_316871 [Phellopilus nigrolimitatus]|nr:hypothetical protein DFH11DRAFT_316871 [Phellopilus nigrolimitatus]